MRLLCLIGGWAWPVLVVHAIPMPRYLACRNIKNQGCVTIGGTQRAGPWRRALGHCAGAAYGLDDQWPA